MTIEANLDFIRGGQAHGSTASRLMAAGMNVNALRTNATLRKDEWKYYDKAVIMAAQQRLVGVAALLRRGLVLNLTNGLGITVLESEKQSDISDAMISMDAVTRGKADRIEFDIGYLPLPIVHKDYYLSARVLEAARRNGTALDTSNAELSARKCSEMVEQYLFMGSGSYSFGGGIIYGLTDFPQRNPVELGGAWDESGYTGQEILNDVLAMKQASIDDRYYGPWILWVPTKYETLLDEDFKANSDKTVRQRLLEVGGITEVQVADKLTGDNVVLCQLSTDVIRMVNGLPITNVEWDSEGGMMHHFKVMTINVPQIRCDASGRCGVVHGAPGS